MWLNIYILVSVAVSGIIGITTAVILFTVFSFTQKIHLDVHKQWNIISYKVEGKFVIAMTCMDLEDIMLSEVSQRKTNTQRKTNPIWSHLYMDSI